jgi:hypothetical protein
MKILANKRLTIHFSFNDPKEQNSFSAVEDFFTDLDIFIHNQTDEESNLKSFMSNYYDNDILEFFSDLLTNSKVEERLENFLEE